ncbi:MAG: hypothetical protein ACI93R_003672 [Flavobacteriales bacterium]|jgi:hypothetical protein
MFKLRQISTVLILLFAVPVAAQVHKWVDDEGNVHFGDRVPDQYKTEAETIKEDTISIVTPETDISRQNRATFNRLAKEQQNENKTQNQAGNSSNSNQRRGAAKEPPTVEECRNRHRTNVKKRTECFSQSK